jgi:small subunit ribosomal protein S17
MSRREMTGVVTSDKMMKTVVVEVVRTYRHPLYKKVVHASKRFKAHDELGAKVGDRVVIVETRPISRDKRWIVESIVRREAQVAVSPAETAETTETAE